MKVLITGAAGFIGFHVVRRLLDRGVAVVGLDSINDYYDTDLKYGRLAQCGIEKNNLGNSGKAVESDLYPGYRFYRMDINDREALSRLFASEKFDRVCHLAAQAGVRYSIEHPFTYIDTNITGFGNMLEYSRRHGIEHFVYASSSSVYGLNEKYPLSVHDRVNHPVSLYAATKKSNELMAHVYSHLYGLPTTGLRFFTVYGPWGRPDMSPVLFAKAIAEDRPIKVFNFGEMERDFTYIDDAVTGVEQALYHIPTGNPDWTGLAPDPASSPAPYRIYNIGNSQPVALTDYIRAIEKAMGKEAVKEYVPMQPGDVLKTFSEIGDTHTDLGFSPVVSLEEGMEKFIQWYKSWYQNGHSSSGEINT